MLFVYWYKVEKLFNVRKWLFYLRVTRDKVLSRNLTAVLIIYASFSLLKTLRQSLQHYESFLCFLP